MTCWVSGKETMGHFGAGERTTGPGLEIVLVVLHPLLQRALTTNCSDLRTTRGTNRTLLEPQTHE